jgi:hypothetical protein
MPLVLNSLHNRVEIHEFIINGALYREMAEKWDIS